MNILLVTMWGNSYKEIADVTVPIMEYYAKKHNYGFAQILLSDSIDWPYKKHEFFKTAYDYDVIFYLDVDCLITNLNIKVEFFIDDKNDLFITKDWNEINGGSLILKRTESGMQLNELIIKMKGIFENEQNAIVWLMGHENFSKFVKILPHPSINSYLYENYKEIGVLTPEQGQWEEGQFILHTPALSFERRIDILSQVNIIE